MEPSIVISVVALVIAVAAGTIAIYANQIAGESNKIAEEAKNISEKSFKIEEQKMKEENSQRKIEHREKIKPYFKLIHLSKETELQTLTIINSGNGSARNFLADIISEYGHKFQRGQPSHNLFKKDIAHNIMIMGDTGKRFTLNLSFEDNEENKYNQDIKYNGSVFDDEFPPQMAK